MEKAPVPWPAAPPSVRVVEGGVLAVAEQEAVTDSTGVLVLAHDLPAVIDPIGLGALARSSPGIGVVEGGVPAVAQQEAVIDPSGVDVESHDLPAVVDHIGLGALVCCGPGIGVVEGGVPAVAQQEAVTDTTGGLVHSHDLPAIVHAIVLAALAGSAPAVGVVDRVEDIPTAGDGSVFEGFQPWCEARSRGALGPAPMPRRHLGPGARFQPPRERVQKHGTRPSFLPSRSAVQ